jgi:hypothetical protein
MNCQQGAVESKAGQNPFQGSRLANLLFTIKLNWQLGMIRFKQHNLDLSTRLFEPGIRRTTVMV